MDKYTTSSASEEVIRAVEGTTDIRIDTEPQTSSSPDNEGELKLSDKALERLALKMAPFISSSIANTMRAMQGKGESTATQEYAQEGATREDDVLSLHARDSSSLNGSFYSKATTRTRASREEGTMEPPNKIARTGVVNPENKITGVICDNENDEPVKLKDNDEPVKLNVAEEMLMDLEREAGFHEEFGPKVSELLAQRTVKYFEKGAYRSESRTALFKKYKLAENLGKIDTPRMNSGILKLNSVKSWHTEAERKLYDIQQNVTRATMAVVSVMNQVLTDEENNRVTDTKTVLRGCLDAISLLGHTSRETSNRRKANIKPCLDSKCQQICSPEIPTTQWLLGDDLSKGARDAKEVAFLEKKSQFKPSSTATRYNNNSNNNNNNYNNNKPAYNNYKSSSSYQKTRTNHFLGKGQKNTQKKK